MKRYFFIALLLFSFRVNSQSEIEVPKFSNVETDLDVKDYITISINLKKEIFFLDKQITIEELEFELFREIKLRTKSKGLKLYRIIIELIADKNLEYLDILPLLTRLRKLGILLIHFVSESDTYSRIDGIWTTGFIFKMNSIEDSRSILSELADSLNYERLIEEIESNSTEDKRTFKIPPPPPPPPPIEITAKEIKEGTLDIKAKVIEVYPELFRVNNVDFTKDELILKLKEWVTNEKHAFLISPKENSKYEDVIFPLAQLKLILIKLWDLESQEKFEMNYSDLTYMKKMEIRNVYPFILVFDE